MQIEGRNPVLEALRGGTPLKSISIEQDINVDTKIETILDLAKKNHIKIKSVPRSKLNKMSKTNIHQGVIAFGSKKDAPSLDTLTKDNDSFLIYIREALYEHNIGAIIRTAECVGATGVILPPKASVTPQVRRAAMGATEHIPVINYNLFQAIKESQEAGLTIVGIERDEKSEELFSTPLPKPLLLIIGGEDRSLSKEILNKCDKTLQIPMRGSVNSLNMSVAAAIVMYEVLRQDMK